MNNHQDVRMVEYQPEILPVDFLSQVDAKQLMDQYTGILDIEPPSFRNDHHWVITSLGNIGFIPIPNGKRLVIWPKIKMGNIFRMLNETYDLKIFKDEHQLYDAEVIQEFFEYLALKLSENVLDRARQGLYKSYKYEEAELPFIRGRINVPAMIHKPIMNRLDCLYEDHTMDVDDNRIIAWTIHSILQRHTLSARVLPVIQQVDRLLKGNVSIQPYTSYDCQVKTYHRLNEDYFQLHLLCKFFLDNMAPGFYSGTQKMIPFLIKTDRLFERFVALWLQKHIGKEYEVEIHDKIIPDEYGMIRFDLDAAIYRAGEQIPICILDTKYKIHEKVSNNDAYQMIAYTTGTGCKNAVLVYPSPLKEPFRFKKEHCFIQSSCFDMTNTDLDESGRQFLSQIKKIISNAPITS